MGRPALRDDEIQEFRDEICDVALRLFAENGFESVTMRGLAERVGCSPAKPYSYFDGKDAILAATRARCFERFADYIETELNGVDDPEEALRVQSSGYLEYAREKPHEFQLMFDLDQDSADPYPDLRAAVRRSWGLVRSSVEDAIDAGVVDADTDEFAQLLWSGTHGIAALEVSGTPGPEWDARQLAEPMVDSLIDAHRHSNSDKHPKE